jgi:hypothetical protein
MSSKCSEVSSVSKTPGNTALTRMPRPPGPLLREVDRQAQQRGLVAE